MKHMHFSRWAALLSSIIFLALFLCGCTQGDIDRAKAAQVKAKQVLEQAKSAEATVSAAYIEIKAIAEQLGREKGAALMARVDKALATASDGVHVAQAMVDASGVIVVAAEKSKAAGGLTIDAVLAGIIAFFTGGASIATAVMPIINRYKRAIMVTAAHADRMEESETQDDVDLAKRISIAEQATAGVTAIIASARAVPPTKKDG